jgi:hypothetical protein
LKQLSANSQQIEPDVYSTVNEKTEGGESHRLNLNRLRTKRMKRIKTLVIALWAVFVNQVAFAQKGTEEQLVKDANNYFKTGEYLKAFPLFSQLVSLYPSNLDYNYKFGACALYSESDKTKAVRFLNQAVSKGVEDPMALYYLGKAYHLNYQFKDAIKAYENFLRNADPKISAKTDAQRLVETCIYGSNLLANIKDISVISKTEADKANFFRYFNLEGIGGKILTVPDELKSKLDMKSTEPGVIHYPGNSTNIFFSSYGKDGATGKDIYKANILPDGKFSTPEKVSGDVNTPYDEDFCFMHSDGKTLYFSSKGHNSMGGYDIFKSVFDEQEKKFGPAINLDFAINTPDDDIFYIADSLNKQAYFASGRASDLTHLNVYNVMVESIPLQIVYIKGEYISEINEEQKKVGIKINDSGTGRMVCDGMTNNSSGQYMMYVPKSGEYLFNVITENSPTVHEVKVEIPYFDKPVALRQEMRLINENGKDKLIVTNYFDAPLEEDISALAAEMLRKKSTLDVNTSAQEIVSTETSPDDKSGELSTYEKTLENATLAAGFTSGTTITSVVADMDKEVTKINSFVSETDQKRDNSYSYALLKQKEAEVALADAEKIRKNLGQIETDEDISQLRLSVELADKAKTLQREARAAINAASSIEQYKASENQRASEIAADVSVIRKAESEKNYDVMLTALTQEKERRTMMRDGQSGSPYAEMLAKAKARESEKSREEEKLTRLRERETELIGQVGVLEQKLTGQKKEKDKVATQNEIAAANSELTNTRNQIVQQGKKAVQSGEEAEMAYANAEFFQKISDDSNYGLVAGDLTSMNETDRTKLSMRVDEMSNRLAALEIKDTQMMALITDEGRGDIAANTNAGIKSTFETDNDISNNPASENTGAGSAAFKSGAAANILSRQQKQITRANADPGLAPSNRMFISQALAETNNAIRILNTKKVNGTITTEEEKALAEFIALAADMNNKLAATPAREVTTAESREAIASVSPDYNDQIQNIINANGTELDKTIQLMAFKEETLKNLQAQKLANANTAAEQDEKDKILQYADADAKLEAAINSLYNETSDVNQYKAAFESDNKAVIESDDVYSDKLERQIEVTEKYLTSLENLEAAKLSELNMAFDENIKNSVNAQLAEIAEEKQQANAKISNYRNDLTLTASASEPVSGKTLEDEMELALNAETPSVSQDDDKPKIEEDAKSIQQMFKPREEAESIFAYESGIFEEIVAKHEKDAGELKNREKIHEINDQIFLVEAEMENEASQSKLRKLDYKAEQLYLKRSLIEIENSASISAMTKKAYDQELSRSNEMVGVSQEKIDQKIMIREEVKRLKRESEINMNNAAELRAQAPAILDDIERADYCRRAFAKEALAIEQLRQMQSICENIDMLNSYSDPDLAMLRTGTVPNAELVNNMAESLGMDASSMSITAAQEDSTEVALNTTQSKQSEIAETPESLLEMTAADSNNTSNQAVNFPVTNDGDVVNDTKRVYADSNNTGNQAVNFPVTNDGDVVNDTKRVSADSNNTGNQAVNFPVANDGDVVNDTKRVYADPNGNVNMTIAVNEPAVTESKAQPNEVSESVEIDSQPGTPVESVKVDAQPIAANVPAANSSNEPEARPAAAESKSRSAASANAADYYYSMPEEVLADLFVRTPRGVYSENKPIPIDAVMPKGIYYKVQIGAFRNDIPQNLYDEFAPISGERLKNGVTRYTAGFFVTFENADMIKKDIRGIGYSDAFVVAFRDGKRIPLYEAMGKTDSPNFVAAVEKEYIYGDKGEAPKSNNAVNAGNSGGSNSEISIKDERSSSNSGTNGINTSYYKGVANAAPATQVETITGLFFTVQVGVYSKPVPAKSLKNIYPLNTELTEAKKIRYTTGRYNNLKYAVEKRSEAKNLGIADAFITAYYNGKRITLSEADRLLKENGAGILVK